MHPQGMTSDSDPIADDGSGSRHAQNGATWSGHDIGQVLRATYRITELIDEGGMGRVYAAEHVRLRRKVAVKVLAQHLSSDVSALARFQREAEIASQLHHPHVVHILDFDTTESGEPYIVMEFLDGEPLSQYIDRVGQLPLLRALQVVNQIAWGLSAAHQAGVVHRDLKPDNVFLLRMQDDSIFVKLLDFGISKRVEGHRKVTREFDVLGTPDYMAPEQAMGLTAKVDHRADQFALAAMSYELFSGQLPFPADSVGEILRKVVSEDPPLLSSFTDVSEEIAHVIQKGLSKSPDDRYESITAFAMALASAVGRIPTPPPYGYAPPGESLPVTDVTKGQFGLTERMASHYSAAPPPVATTTPAPVRHNSSQATLAAVVARRASTPAMPAEPRARLSDLSDALEEVRRALAFGETDLAYSEAQRVLDLCRQVGTPEASQLLSRSAELLDRVFEARLGDLKRRPHAMPRSEGRGPSLTPEMAYLLSLLDERFSIEELIDLSPMSRTDTLRLLSVAVDQGLVGLS